MFLSRLVGSSMVFCLLLLGIGCGGNGDGDSSGGPPTAGETGRVYVRNNVPKANNGQNQLITVEYFDPDAQQLVEIKDIQPGERREITKKALPVGTVLNITIRVAPGYEYATNSFIIATETTKATVQRGSLTITVTRVDSGSDVQITIGT